MGFFKRALLYVIRKKGKSVLLSAIFFVMATFVLTGISIWRASDTALQKVRQSLGGKFELAVDYTDDNPYLHKEVLPDNSFVIYSEKQLTPETVKEIRNIPGVKYCDAGTETLTVFQELSLFVGNIPVLEEYRQSSKTRAVWRSQENGLFTSGALTLTEGRHIMEGDKNKAIISKDLAEKSGLKTGDILTVENTAGEDFRVEIAGLFHANVTERITDQVTSYDKIHNLVFIDMNTATAIESSSAVTGFQSVAVTIDDPQNMESIQSAVKELSSIDWKAFTLTTDDEDWQKTAAPLMTLNRLTVTLLAVSLTVSAVILSLILTLWSRGRIHETGIYLSVGIKKRSVIGQYLTEALLIAVVSFSLSCITTNAVSGQLGRLLYDQSAPADDVSAVSGVMAVSDPDLFSPVLDISIGLDSILLLYMAGVAVILIAVVVASVPVMKLKPGEILAGMS